MLIFKQKRGMKELYKIIIEIFLAIMVTTAAISYAVSVGTGTRLLKEKTARDLALTMEAIEASPGAVFLSYADLRGFVYGFLNNRINVYSIDEDVTKDSNTYYFFPKDLALNFIIPKEKIYPLEDQNRTVLSFKKTPPDFFINNNDLTLESMNCEKIDVSKDEKLIFIYDSTGQGLQFFDKKNKEEINKLIQQSLIPSLQPGLEARYYTDKEKFEQEFQNKKTALFIEIRGVDYIEDSSAKIYINSERKSRRLACIIKNRIYKQNLVATINIGDFDSQPTTILRIEIGSLNRGTIINEIGGAINEYFGK
ncbi:MAG: hypothetical protein QXG86_00305 [Candidatus Woesearchaeota archaeon]